MKSVLKQALEAKRRAKMPFYKRLVRARWVRAALQRAGIGSGAGETGREVDRR
jgi:hypothetical protein